MLYTFAKQIDWKQISNHKQEIIEKTNIKETSKIKYFDYKENDIILFLNKQGPKGKLKPSTLPEGQWKITQVHTNGTISTLRKNYVERIMLKELTLVESVHSFFQ